MGPLVLDWSSISEIVNLLLALALLYLRRKQVAADSKAEKAEEKAVIAHERVNDVQRQVDQLPIRSGTRGLDHYNEVSRAIEVVAGHERRLLELERQVSEMSGASEFVEVRDGPR